MSADIYKHVTDFLAVLLTGCVIKLMDDYLDQEFDIFRGKHSLARQLGLGTAAYALLIFAISVSLNRQISVALFLAAYITGMVYHMRTKYLSGLSGWQETCIVFVLSWLLAGLNITCAAVCILLVVQIIDDWLDETNDALTGQKNALQILGTAESGICALIFLLLALYLDTRLSLFVLLATPLAVWIINKAEIRRMMP
ncbi:MAG TPA: hypothetical protein VN462_04205 [Negativicutes bacterium]|nr:hypothetical protein [Negativicutes bacterium]